MPSAPTFDPVATAAVSPAPVSIIVVARGADEAVEFDSYEAFDQWQRTNKQPFTVINRTQGIPHYSEVLR